MCVGIDRNDVGQLSQQLHVPGLEILAGPHEEHIPENTVGNHAEHDERIDVAEMVGTDEKGGPRREILQPANFETEEDAAYQVDQAQPKILEQGESRARE